MTWIVERNGQFVIPALAAYHGGLNSGYNVVNATDLPTFSWPEGAGTVRRNCKLKRLKNQWVISIEMNLGKKAVVNVASQERTGDIKLYTKCLAKSLFMALERICTKAERIFHHFVENDKETVLSSDEHIDQTQSCNASNANANILSFASMPTV